MYSIRSFIGAWEDWAQCRGIVLPIQTTVNICRYKQTAVKLAYMYKEKFPANRAGCLAGNTETYSTHGIRNCLVLPQAAARAVFSDRKGS